MAAAPDDIRAYFAARAARYDAGNWQREDLCVQERSAIEALPRDLDVGVDLGTGPGKSVELVLSRARQVYAVDLSPEMMGPGHPRATNLVADAHDLPLEEGSADLVYARMSIHYMDLLRLKAELCRVICEGGFLVIVSAFPYGATDEAWFNERHEIKGKPCAHTPTIPDLVDLLSPDFRLKAAQRWERTSLLSKTIDGHLDTLRGSLRGHIEEASDEIKSIYCVSELPDGDITLVFRWAALTFELFSGGNALKPVGGE